MPLPTVTVELYGMARQRAGRPVLAVHGATVADAVRNVERDCPGLGGMMTCEGYLSRQYLYSFDGTSFIDDPALTIPAGSRLLILGADAGG